jgi:hypothetical protein
MMRLRRYFLLIGFILIFLLLLLAYFRREHYYIIFYQNLVNGESVKILVDRNARIPLIRIKKDRFGYEHWKLGGGGDKINFYIKFRTKTFKADLGGTIYLINYWNGKFYFVTNTVVDSEDIFQFYLYEEGFRKISYKDFPKEIAVVNMFYRRGFPAKYEYNIPNLNDPKFSVSVTAQLWKKLEKGTNPNEIFECMPNIGGVYNKPINENFIKKYYKKYIAPHWTKCKLTENETVLLNYHEKMNKDDLKEFGL